MTRMHFIELAKALKFNAPDNTAGKAETLLFRNIVSAVATVCKRANSRFDLARFETAAGVVTIQAG
jgi:hypothetical protein